MKKLTGPAILATVLMAHVGFLIATEESYTFRESEYEFEEIRVPVNRTAESVTMPSASVQQATMFVVDDQGVTH